MGNNEKYVPALNFDWLTPFYDGFIKWFMPEAKFKNHLIEQAGIQEGYRVLDLGCGTATLTLMTKQAHPDAEVMGLDGDAKILKIARKKVAAAGFDIPLHEGMAYHLPFDRHSFDRVLSSLILHHLTLDNNRRALAEVFRVLKPEGEFHVADFQRTNESLTTMLGETGFALGEEYSGYRTIMGRLRLWRAQRP